MSSTVLPARPLVRVVPVPRLEPPADHELVAAGVEPPPASAPALPIDLPMGQRRPRRIQPAVQAEIPRRLAPAEPTDFSVMVPVVRRLLATFLEVAGGFRPIAHLRPFCRPERFGLIVDQLSGCGDGKFRGAASAAINNPIALRGRRPGRPVPPPSTERLSVRRVQICELRGGAAEVAVVLSRHDRVWAMALRMECRRGRWLCTYLELV